MLRLTGFPRTAWHSTSRPGSESLASARRFPESSRATAPNGCRRGPGQGAAGGTAIDEFSATVRARMTPSAQRILAFDTSAQTTSLALWDVGALSVEGVTIEQHLPADNKHAETLLPSLQTMLKQAGCTLEQIDAIAVGVGPGSFTGVRVGVATAKGLGLSLQKPVLPVVSLDALAHEALEHSDATLIAACLDAFKGELFCALYTREGSELRCDLPPFHASPGAVRAALAAASGGRPLALVGGGVARYAELLADAPLGWKAHEAIVAPRARVVAQLAAKQLVRGEIPDLARVSPVYVRDSDAQLPKVPLRV